MASPIKRAGRARRALKRLGLSPSHLITSEYGAGFTVSLAPAVDWPPYDVEGRARGPSPHDLRAIVDALKWRHRPLVRVTGIDVAMDLVGLPGLAARRRLLPSISAPMLDESQDSIRLKGWLHQPAGPGRARGAWRDVEGTAYARPRRSSRNLCVYVDRPSKVDPSGPPALHIELRVKNSYLPKGLRDGPELLPFQISGPALLRLLAQHLELDGTLLESRACGDDPRAGSSAGMRE